MKRRSDMRTFLVVFRWLVLSLCPLSFFLHGAGGSQARAAGDRTGRIEPGAPPGPSGVQPRVSVRPPTVRDFAWADATYDFGGGEKETFSHGYAEDLNEEGRCNVCSHLRAVTFGDIDGDGREEALLVVGTNLGGAGTMISGYVFALENGRPVLRAEIEGGDRGEGGVESLAVKDGKIIVRRFVYRGRGGDDVNHPSAIEVQAWRWDGTKLVEAGKPRVVPRPRRHWTWPERGRR